MQKYFEKINQALLFFNIKAARCPYCRMKIARVSENSKKCSRCKKKFYVLKDERRLTLLTEGQYQDNKTFEKIEKLGYTWQAFIQFKQNFFSSASEDLRYNDFLWGLYGYLLNEKAKTEDFSSMKCLYELMAALTNDKTEFNTLKKQATLMQLYKYKKQVGPDGYVEVVCNDDACESCKDLSKNKILINEAIKNPPIPHENCTRTKCNCEIIAKSAAAYIVKGYLIKGYDVYRWNKLDGDHVKKGEDVCKLRILNEQERILYENDTYEGQWDFFRTIQAEADGILEVFRYAKPYSYFEFSTHLDKKSMHLSKKEIFAIHKYPDKEKLLELKNKRFTNIPYIKVDEFTGEKEIKWKSVCGRSIQYSDMRGYDEGLKDCIILGSDEGGYDFLFTFQNIAGRDYIVFRYLPKEYKLIKGSKISFLFDNGEVHNFILPEKPYEHSKVYSDNRKVRLNEAKALLNVQEINALKNIAILKWKIETPNSGKTITGSIDSEDMQFAIKKLAKEYSEILEKEIFDDQHKPVTAHAAKSISYTKYTNPPINLLIDHAKHTKVLEDKQLADNKKLIIQTLKDFEIDIDTIEAIIGPNVTLYELTPARGVRLSKIKNLEDDITLALSALGIRISTPLPGKGTVGIEVPNKKPAMVSFKSLVESEEFGESKFHLPLSLGKTIDNKPYIIDLTKMPHILMAGATGQGKSVGLNVIISSLLYNKNPEEVKFVLIDPKKVEFAFFNALKDHFLISYVKKDQYILTERKEIIETLNALCHEMDNRFDLLQDAKVKNIHEYNEKIRSNKLTKSDKNHALIPYIVLVVDEFADLMMGSADEVEKPITRLAQLSRAVGIHLVIATQRPSVNVITGLIKANFPARIAYRVASRFDSRTILDSAGAEKLIGKGDMLFSAGSDFVRLQCPFISTGEIENIVEFISKQKDSEH